MKQKLVNAVKLLIYATFFVPLLVLPSSFIFPFIVPKILLFRSLVALMIGCYILLLFINWQEFKPRFSALNLALAAFLASFAISTFVGVDPYHSFWDNHERMLGLFTVFHYIAYYFICSSVFKNWAEWSKALKVFLVAGSVVTFLGVLEIFLPNILLNQGSLRVMSTLGNPIYLGGYGLFLTFVALLLFVKETKVIWRWVEAVCAMLAVVANFYSDTRGSIVGLAVGLAVAVIAYAIVLKDRVKLRKALIGVIILGAIAFALLYAFRKTAFVTNIPAVGRAVNTTYSVLKGTARWVAWGVALESWKDHPVFGWGPNNFFYAFNMNYNPWSLHFGYGETWFDNAHNIILNTLAVQGVVGLAAYLLIFTTAIWQLVVAYRKKSLHYHLFVVGLAFLAAHLVSEVTVFENPTSYLYFMFWLAMVNQITKIAPVLAETKQNHQKVPVISDKRVSGGAVSVVGLVVFLVVFIFDIQPARANMKTLNAMKILTYAPAQGIAVVQEALAFNSPHIDDIRSDLGRTMAQTLGNADNKLTKDQSSELFHMAEDALVENTRLHPLDVRNYLTLSQLYQVEFSLTNDNRYIAEYGNSLETALKFSPKRQQIVYNLANFYLQTNQTDKAVELLQGAIKDEPQIGESYWRLAYTYRLIGKMDKAKEIIDLAAQNNVDFSDSEKGIIQQVLAPLPTTTASKK